MSNYTWPDIKRQCNFDSTRDNIAIYFFELPLKITILDLLLKNEMA